MQIAALNWVDYTILGIIIISMLISLVRGFIREALSLATWIVGIWVGIKYCGVLGEYLKPYLTATPVRTGVSFFILFLGVLIAGAIISFIITQLIHKTGLSGTDRILGLVFGLSRGLLVVAVILLLVTISGVPKDDWWKNSSVIPKFQPLTVWLRDLLPESLKSNTLDKDKSSKDNPTNNATEGTITSVLPAVEKPAETTSGVTY